MIDFITFVKEVTSSKQQVASGASNPLILSTSYYLLQPEVAHANS